MPNKTTQNYPITDKYLHIIQQRIQAEPDPFLRETLTELFKQTQNTAPKKGAVLEAKLFEILLKLGFPEQNALIFIAQIELNAIEKATQKILNSLNKEQKQKIHKLNALGINLIQRQLLLRALSERLFNKTFYELVEEELIKELQKTISELRAMPSLVEITKNLSGSDLSKLEKYLKQGRIFKVLEIIEKARENKLKE